MAGTKAGYAKRNARASVTCDICVESFTPTSPGQRRCALCNEQYPRKDNIDACHCGNRKKHSSAQCKECDLRDTPLSQRRHFYRPACDVCREPFDGVSSRQNRCSPCLVKMPYDYNFCACGLIKRRRSPLCQDCKTAKRGLPPGVIRLKSGYIKIRRPMHTRADVNGYVMEHIVVMTEYLGRNLYPDENIHHKNGQRDDNALTNLELWSSSQPAGQRVEDKVTFALKMLRRYRPELGL